MVAEGGAALAGHVAETRSQALGHGWTADAVVGVHAGEPATHPQQGEQERFVLPADDNAKMFPASRVQKIYEKLGEDLVPVLQPCAIDAHPIPGSSGHQPTLTIPQTFRCSTSLLATMTGCNTIHVS